MKTLLTYSFLILLTSAAFTQEAKRVLLVDGFLHIGNGQVVESAAIGISKGQVEFVKNSLAMTINESEWDTVISLKGKHVYPGFVAPNSTLGLTEIDAVRATRDFHEVGEFNPHIRSQIAFNTESRVIATVVSNGVLLAQATPRGGVISGTSSMMRLTGWNWEDATAATDDGVHVNWPTTYSHYKQKREDLSKQSEAYQREKTELYDFFTLAKSFAEAKKSSSDDQRLAAMTSCFQGNKRVYFHASELQQLLDIIEFVNHFKLKYPVIIGGYDSYLITRQLVDANIPLMLSRLHSLPEREEDDVNLPFKLPFLLRQAGVKFCLQNEGDMEAMNARNLPFLGGTARAYGLTEEEAVGALSLHACEIMGIADNYGSIEAGKSATLFVSDGDALEMTGNNVCLALIDGIFVDLNNHQKQLYLKYSNKYK